jgi:homogentisate phytyltransferase/homogentisate geranylgeranyltransferase
MAAGRARSPRHALAVLWRFSRPHTIVGTALSILGLHAIAVGELPGVAPGDGLGDLAWTLLAGACVNVAIVGVNQITDVELDRRNKPWLPLAAGELTSRSAWWIVAVAAAAPVALALTQGALELAAVAAALAVGAAYSLPPLHLKRFPVAASLSISGVRSIAVNLGVYGHFARSLGDGAAIAAPVWALTAFVLPFAFAIAVLKDVPDMEGDREFSIGTFAVRLGPRRAARVGQGALVLAYAGMIVLGPLLLAGEVEPGVLVAGHAVALAVLLRWSAAADPDDAAGFARFYQRVWVLFFLEYLLVPLAVLLSR